MHGIKSKSAAIRQEFVCFTELCRTQALSSVRDICLFAIKRKVEYPSVSAVAERLLVAPVSAVDCERAFSRQNLIKTNLRNSLKVTTLDNLMRLSMCEDSVDNFDYISAFKQWVNMKNRRIMDFMVPKY
ncbi:hypothetical protein FSP39_006345 [Pinctada imbricata]|uniref:HAT C-terminal dimerisation domain-containing protein n=1 Tax=Pinctada imbricata TaxID=66713 RepID=A0AA88Y2G2_PINIB|nr:hypothetical protein FSP39_006345 [Pinctada imbricata]